MRNEDIVADDDQQKELTYSDFSWKINGQDVNLPGNATPELNTWVKESGAMTFPL